MKFKYIKMLVHDLHDLVPPYSYIFVINKTGFTITIIVLKIVSYVQGKANLAFTWVSFWYFIFWLVLIRKNGKMLRTLFFFTFLL